MLTYWEKLGVLGPIYRLAGRGLNDCEIADQLKLTEVTVHNCIAWILHFMKYANRAELVRYASAAQPVGFRFGLRAA